MKNAHTQHLPAAALAFVLWGGWAWLANGASSSSLLAGLLQGSASAAITLLMAAVINWLFTRMPSRPLAILLPPCLVVSVTTSLLYLIHSLGDTNNLWLTILPPSSIAFAFCLYLTIRLSTQATPETRNSEHTP